MDREVQCLIIGRAESKARVVPWPRIRHGGGETRLPSLQRDREDVKTTLSPPNFQAFKAERNFRRPIFLFERHTPFSSPSIHPHAYVSTHTWRLSPSLDDSSRRFSLLSLVIARSTSLVGDSSRSMYRATIFGEGSWKKLRDSTTPLGLGFSSRRSFHCCFTLFVPSLKNREQVKKVVIGSLPPSFFFPFLSFFIPNSRHKFLDEGTPRGRCHKRFVAKRLFTPLLLHLLN